MSSSKQLTADRHVARGRGRPPAQLLSSTMSSRSNSASPAKIAKINRPFAVVVSIEPPTGFMRRAWRSAVVRDGEIDVRAYELCLLVELQDRLRSGDVWVVGSRQYRSVEDQLLPRELFKQIAQAGPLPASVPQNPRTFLDERQALLHRRLQEVEAKASVGARHERTMLESGFYRLPVSGVQYQYGFSPTDTPVLSPWAKVMVMIQALISFTTVAPLAARAVNIL